MMGSLVLGKRLFCSNIDEVKVLFIGETKGTFSEFKEVVVLERLSGLRSGRHL